MFSNNFILNSVVVFLITLVLVVIIYFKYAYSYWRRRGTPYLEPSIPFGNTRKPVNVGLHFGIITTEWYRQLKTKGYSYGGVYGFTKPFFVLGEPRLIERVCIQDLHFVNYRGMYYDEKNDPLSGSLLTYPSEKWRKNRVKLAPLFSALKLKMLFNLVNQCCGYMEEALKAHARNGTVEMKELTGCFTTDVIGSAAFGLDCNSFKHKDAEFRKFGRLVFSPNLLVNIIQYVTIVAPELSKKLGLGVTDKGVIDFFTKAVEDAVHYRKENNIKRQDLLQTLIDMREETKNTAEEISMEELVGQAFLLFTAGYETSATTLTFALYQLASNQDFQDKAREEIRRVLEEHGGKLTYEAVKEMKYVHQIIDETLRKHPPVPVLERCCLEDYKLPGTDIVLEKDILILIPTYALHNDPEFFPDPEKFDPERFNEKNKKLVVPYTYLPFGAGPRVCLGQKLGQMQITMGIATILKDYEFTVNSKMGPIEYEPEGFLLLTKNKFILDIKKTE